MGIKYSDITQLINDEIKDVNFINNRTAEVLRAINNALDYINRGEAIFENGAKLEVGYDWQRDTVDVSFVSGTTDYTFTALGITNFKFTSDLRIDSDENVLFEELETKDFIRKLNVFSNSNDSYNIWWNNNTQYLRINYNTTDTLNFEFFSNYMVSKGGTLQENFSDSDNENETLLIPDRFKMVVVYYSCSELARQRTRDNNTDADYFYKKASIIARQLIDNLGTLRKKPSRRVRIRSERMSSLRWLKTND